MGIVLGSCILLLITGFLLVIYGVVKAIRCKCREPLVIIWCFGGNVLIIMAGLLARFIG